MSDSDAHDEPRRGVKRGAFPARSSDLENATPFEPGAMDAGDADDDSSATDADGRTDSGAGGDTPKP